MSLCFLSVPPQKIEDLPRLVLLPPDRNACILESRAAEFCAKTPLARRSVLGMLVLYRRNYPHPGIEPLPCTASLRAPALQPHDQMGVVIRQLLSVGGILSSDPVFVVAGITGDDRPCACLLVAAVSCCGKRGLSEMATRSSGSSPTTSKACERTGHSTRRAHRNHCLFRLRLNRWPSKSIEIFMPLPLAAGRLSICRHCRFPHAQYRQSSLTDNAELLVNSVFV